MKKFLIFVVLFLCSYVSFAYDFVSNGIYYKKLSSNTCSVTYKSVSNGSFAACYKGSITIPQTVTYSGVTYSVTGIENSAFNTQAVTSVQIGSNVKSIGSYAFSDCLSLTSITLPSGITSIQSHAFYYCSKLTKINIPASVTSIGDNAFAFCSVLADVTLPNSLKTIDASAFKNCKALNKIIFPENVTEIKSTAFENCPLNDVYCRALTPPTVASTTFSNYKTLHVYPYRASTYKAHSIWSKFTISTTWPQSFCEKPSVSYNDGQLIFKCSTPNAQINYTISSETTANKTGNTKSTVAVPFAPVYKLTCYATASGYERSDNVTMSIPISLGLNGDMNGDGKRTIVDVTRLVEIVKEGK